MKSYEELNPLLGGAEAEGFGVGIRHGKTHPGAAMKASHLKPSPPPERGSAGKQPLGRKIQIPTSQRASHPPAVLSYENQSLRTRHPV